MQSKLPLTVKFLHRKMAADLVAAAGALLDDALREAGALTPA
jgi:hypothetical protein